MHDTREARTPLEGAVCAAYPGRLLPCNGWHSLRVATSSCRRGCGPAKRYQPPNEADIPISIWDISLDPIPELSSGSALLKCR